MADQVRFSCVIPTYNRAQIVGTAIRSALEQEHTPAEVIVVDDGSSDGTEALVRSFGDSVRYVSQENSGGAVARNRGAAESLSEWIAFLDSDDYWTPCHLRAMAAAIEGTDGSADFYFADLQRTAAEDGVRHWERARFSISAPWERIADGVEWVIRPRIPMMLQASVFARDRFIQKGALKGELRRRHDTHAFILHGTGSPVCAVANLGTIMTSDDTTGTRLTEQMNVRTKRYHEYSRQVWADLISRLEGVAGSREQLLRHRLARAHIGLARCAMREGELRECARNVWRGLHTRSRTVAALLLRDRRSEWERFTDLWTPEG